MILLGKGQLCSISISSSRLHAHCREHAFLQATLLDFLLLLNGTLQWPLLLLLCLLLAAICWLLLSLM